MSNDDDEVPYLVGYRKPPKSTQFRPGKSGNPKGRKALATTVKAKFQAKLHKQMKMADGTTSTPLDIIVARAVSELAGGKPGKWAQTVEFLSQFDPKQKFKPTSNDEERLNKLIADMLKLEDKDDEV